MKSMPKRMVCVSEKAYHELSRIIHENPNLYKATGRLGVIDQLLFGEFTQAGRGNSHKKCVDKK